MNIKRYNEMLSNDDKMLSIQEFDNYLKSSIDLIYSKNEIDKLRSQDESMLGFRNFWQNRYKNFERFKNDPVIISQTIDVLYPFSLSKRHSSEKIEDIVNILSDIEDDDFIEIRHVNPSYDMNIKNTDGTLVPRYVIYFKTKPKEEWRKPSSGPFDIGDVKGRKYYHMMYSKYSTFLGYGLKLTHSSSNKASLSDIS